MPTTPDETIGAERLILQAMCQGTPQGSVREEARRLLSSYRWREPSHQIMFEVLLSIPSDDPERVRDQLPTRLTRRGFPDLAWEDALRPHRLSKDQAERLIHQLAERGSACPPLPA